MLASSDTNDPVPLSTENGVIMDVDHKEVQATPLSVVGLTDLDKKQEAASLSSPVSSYQVEIGLGTVSEAKEGLPCDTAEQLSCEAFGQSLPIKNNSSMEPGNEPQAPAGGEVGKDHTKVVNVSPVLCESTEKVANVAEAPEGHNRATKDKFLGRETADSSGDCFVCKLSCFYLALSVRI